MAISKKELSATLPTFLKDFETSVEQSNYSLKKQCDRLAGFLDITLETLVANGHEDFVLLKHDELRRWYVSRLDIKAKKVAAAEAKARKAEVRARVIARLTEEEKAAMGVKK